MNGQKVMQWRQQTKQRLLAGFDNRCNKCGYQGCAEAFDFHHLDSKTKKFTIAKALQTFKRWEEIEAEAVKCICLCCRCHREHHAGVWQLSDIIVVKFVDTSEVSKRCGDTVTGTCPVCGTDVCSGKICCSSTCAGKRARRIIWPSPEELSEALKSRSRLSLARQLGVSDTAVKKHQKKYCLVGESVSSPTC